jgi:hypothetical protein
MERRLQQHKNGEIIQMKSTRVFRIQAFVIVFIAAV